MAVASELSADGEELVIRVSGRFDFSAHQAFRDAYELLPDRPRHLCCPTSVQTQWALPQGTAQ